MANPPLRATRPDTVTDRLRDVIIRGRLAPGARITEAEIAERLGISRTPAREAIQRLFQEGFLRQTGTLRRTDLIVAPLTTADMWDLYLIMASLEGSAALAVGDLDTATLRALVKELKQMEEELERAAAQRLPEYDKLFELHNRFHARIVSVAPRPRLHALISSIRPLVDRYEWAYVPLVGPDFSDTFDEHAEIIRAIRDGSGKRAQQSVAANWERGAARLARAIERVGPRGNW